jgi:uncharacterized protein with FMN-binding domain
MSTPKVKKPIKSVVPTEIHRDVLGREFKEGQYVAVSDGYMCIAQVIRFTPKMVAIEVIGKKYRSKRLKYASEMVILDGPDIFMWILTNGL